MNYQIRSRNSKHATHIKGGFICSAHADARKQQRGISDRLVDILLEYGRYTYLNGQHVFQVSLDKLGVKKIQRNEDITVDVSKLRKLYVILAEDNRIITCAYR